MGRRMSPRTRERKRVLTEAAVLAGRQAVDHPKFSSLLFGTYHSFRTARNLVGLCRARHSAASAQATQDIWVWPRPRGRDTMASPAVTPPLLSDRKKAKASPGQSSNRGGQPSNRSVASSVASSTALPEKKKKKKKKKEDKPKAELPAVEEGDVPADVTSLMAEVMCGTPRGGAYGSPASSSSAARAATSGAAPPTEAALGAANAVNGENGAGPASARTSSSEAPSTDTSATEEEESEEEELAPRHSVWEALHADEPSEKLVEEGAPADATATAPAPAAPVPVS